MKYFILLFLFLTNAVAFGQNYEFGDAKLLKKESFGYFNELKITASHQDNFGNLYIAGYSFGSWSKCGNYAGCYTYVLYKFNIDGELLWQYDFLQNQLGFTTDVHSAFINAITTDNIGNLFVSGNFGCPEGCEFGNISLNHDDTQYTLRGFMAELNNSNGDYKWLWTHKEGYGSKGITDIKHKNGMLYAAYYLGTKLIYNGDDSNAVIIPNDIGIIELKTNGEIIKTSGAVRKQGTDRYNIINPSNSSSNSARLIVANPKIEFTNENLILTGTSNGIYYKSGTNQYVSVEDPGSYAFTYDMATDVWTDFNQYMPNLKVNYPKTSQVIPVTASDEKNFYSATNYPEDLDIVFDNSNNIVKKGALVQKFNTSSKISQWTIRLEGDVRCVDMVKKEDNLILTGVINDSFSIGEITINSVEGFDDIFLLTLDSDGNYINHKVIGSVLNDYPYGFIEHNNGLDLLGYAQHSLKIDGENVLFETEASFTLPIDETILGDSSFGTINLASIFPNPTTSSINVNMERFSKTINLKLTTINNRVIFQSVWHNKKNIDFKVDAQSGIYFLTVKTDVAQKVFKIIKR